MWNCPAIVRRQRRLFRLDLKPVPFTCRITVIQCGIETFGLWRLIRKNKTMLELALQQIIYARGYTQTLLADIPDELWFQQPNGCASNIAWQVAHLAFAEYALTLMRVRGKEPG